MPRGRRIDDDGGSPGRDRADCPKMVRLDGVATSQASSRERAGNGSADAQGARSLAVFLSSSLSRALGSG